MFLGKALIPHSPFLHQARRKCLLLEEIGSVNVEGVGPSRAAVLGGCELSSVAVGSMRS